MERKYTPTKHPHLLTHRQFPYWPRRAVSALQPIPLSFNPIHIEAHGLNFLFYDNSM